MKKFSFRLEPVLEYRSEKEKKAVLEQSLAQKEYLGQLSILEDICYKLDGALENETDNLAVGERLARSLYIDYLTASRARQEKVVEGALRELEKKRQKVIKARKETLVLQNLKDRLQGRYMKELNRWEAKTIDDQCTVLTHRKRGIGG
ncbi:MAG: flagellar FliJ family protein [Peptococcaceae bacterium]|nr:flagellar FliJ family protein [Peptococcaceae bacterium]